MRATLCGLLLIVTSILATCPIAGQQRGETQPLASVTFYIIDENGRAIDWKIDSFTSNKRDMSSHFRGLQGTQIPYDIYDFVLKSPTPTPFHARIPVYAPEVFRVVTLSREQMMGFSTDVAASPAFVIRGRLDPMPETSRAEPVWIRLQPVFQTGIQRILVDVSVDPSGEFRIYEPLMGRYLLTVIQGESVLSVQQMSFEEDFQPASISVRLPDKPPQIIYVRPDPK